MVNSNVGIIPTPKVARWNEPFPERRFGWKEDNEISPGQMMAKPPRECGFGSLIFASLSIVTHFRSSFPCPTQKTGQGSFDLHSLGWLNIFNRWCRQKLERWCPNIAIGGIQLYAICELKPWEWFSWVYPLSRSLSYNILYSNII